MALAAGGKKIVFSKGGAKVTDKKSGKTSTYKKSSSSGYVRTSTSKSKGSSSSAPSIKKTSSGTKVSFVSDAKSDIGKAFSGTKILSPKQYQTSKSIRTGSSITSKATTKQQDSNYANLIQPKFIGPIKPKTISNNVINKQNYIGIGKQNGYSTNNRISRSGMVFSDIIQKQKTGQVDNVNSIYSNNNINLADPFNLYTPNNSRNSGNFNVGGISSGAGIKSENVVVRKNPDSSFLRGVKAGGRLLASPVIGFKKVAYDEPQEITQVIKENPQEFSNYQQVLTGQQTPSIKTQQLSNTFDDINFKYAQDQDVKNLIITTGFIGAGVAGGALSGVAGAGLGASSARLAGSGIGWGVKGIYGATLGAKGYETIKNPTAENIGELTVLSVPAGIKGKQVVQNRIARVGAKEVPAETVFDPVSLQKNLQGEKTFATSKNPKEALQKFKESTNEQGKTIVSHATPNRKSFTSETEIKGGPMGLKNKEDIGLYAAPSKTATGEGGASVAFTGTTGNSGYTLNPFYKNPKPGVIQVEVPGGVKTQPTGVIGSARKGDFSKVNEYLLDKSDKTSAYQTARSTLRQTSETEAVIPASKDVIPGTTDTMLVNKFKDSGSWLDRLRGYNKYTVVEGKTIPIKEYKLKEFSGLKKTTKPKSKEPIKQGKNELNLKDYNKNYYESISKGYKEFIPIVPSNLMPSHNIKNIMDYSSSKSNYKSSPSESLYDYSSGSSGSDSSYPPSDSSYPPSDSPITPSEDSSYVYDDPYKPYDYRTSGSSSGSSSSNGKSKPPYTPPPLSGSGGGLQYDPATGGYKPMYLRGVKVNPIREVFGKASRFGGIKK